MSWRIRNLRPVWARGFFSAAARNPFRDLKERLRQEEQDQGVESRRRFRDRRALFRRLNRSVRRALWQLTDALEEAEVWRARNLSVRSIPPSRSHPNKLGWEVFYLRNYPGPGWRVGPRDFVDVLVVSLALDSDGEPFAFRVFYEESGEDVLTKGLRPSELVEALRSVFEEVR
jgi:hypothetical protein